MAEIHLHGALERFHPDPLFLSVTSPAEAVRLLAINFEGFERALRAGVWRIVRGPLDGDDDQEVEQLRLGIGAATELHFVPALEGAKGSGKAILGAVIMVAAIATAPWGGAALGAEAFSIAGMSVSHGAIALFGASMLMSGISTMMARPAKTREQEEDKSYIFSGPQNRLEQGAAVPLVYGRARVGSVLISAAIANDDITVDPAVYTANTTGTPVITGTRVLDGGFGQTAEYRWEITIAPPANAKQTKGFRLHNLVNAWMTDAADSQPLGENAILAKEMTAAPYRLKLRQIDGDQPSSFQATAFYGDSNKELGNAGSFSTDPDNGGGLGNGGDR